MTRRERYNLVFKKKFVRRETEFVCCLNDNNQLDHDPLARKLTLMHVIECQALVDEIAAAESNEYYEEYFPIDNDATSDDDEIQIRHPYVIIDKQDFIPFQDMKELLSEWILFKTE